ncbi:unnamed protein product [Ilex paraguariensis]|uniref:HTH myb-type domain-containing protein n=1 Tax=Ilex paraguariensis TaxID=185542 RepID=A0ABC8TKL0_9AQUA
MLAVSPFGNTRDEREGEMESFSIGGDEFSDFCGGNLLDSIDFDDFFGDIDNEDALPNLDMDPESLAELSASGGEESEMNISVSVERADDNSVKDEEDKVSGSGFGSGSSLNQGEEIVSKRDEPVGVHGSPKEVHKGRKSSTQSKNSQGKRKVKVDWTPELHRRFVQAVEQLGVDKAVPSRILEVMGIDCLTRHNIASHLQKYRSHRKHLLAREAEAASWSQRRQLYGGGTTGGGGGGNKREMSLWVAPTMGFPPMAPMHHFRPLHVWGHPSVDQSLVHIWPKQIAPSPSPPPPQPPTWPPAPPLHPPPADPSFWHPPRQRVPIAPTPGTPCFPPTLAPMRFPTGPVPSIPRHAMYKVDPGIGVPAAPTGQTCSRPPFDFHPSKESIDATIGDVLSKPWLPLPLGLKSPSTDIVVDELQRQGTAKHGGDGLGKLSFAHGGVELGKLPFVGGGDFAEDDHVEGRVAHLDGANKGGMASQPSASTRCSPLASGHLTGGLGERGKGLDARVSGVKTLPIATTKGANRGAVLGARTIGRVWGIGLGANLGAVLGSSGELSVCVGEGATGRLVFGANLSSFGVQAYGDGRAEVRLGAPMTPIGRASQVRGELSERENQTVEASLLLGETQ